MTLPRWTRRARLEARWASRVSFVLTLSLLLPMALVAQVESGRVVGTVSDTSGAVVPGASITVKNIGTGAEHHATTDNSGQFTLRSEERRVGDSGPRRTP